MSQKSHKMPFFQRLNIERYALTKEEIIIKKQPYHEHFNEDNRKIYLELEMEARHTYEEGIKRGLMG